MFLNMISTSNMGCQRLVFLIAYRVSQFMKPLPTITDTVFFCYLIQVLSHSSQFISEVSFTAHQIFEKRQLLG